MFSPDVPNGGEGRGRAALIELERTPFQPRCRVQVDWHQVREWLLRLPIFAYGLGVTVLLAFGAASLTRGQLVTWWQEQREAMGRRERWLTPWAALLVLVLQPVIWWRGESPAVKAALDFGAIVLSFVTLARMWISWRERSSTHDRSLP